MTKKKKIIIILAAILCSLLLISITVFFAFFYEAKEVVAKAENTYESIYNAFCTQEHDEDIEIDGVLDENAWQNKKWFTNVYTTDVSGNMPKLKVTAFPTEYGIYIASVVTDTNLVSDGQRSPKMNSNWEFYITADNVGETRVNSGMYRVHYNIDMRGESFTRQPNFERAIVVDGELNSGETKGATLEMFIPWSEFRVDTSKGIPTEFRILPGYLAVLPGQNETSLLSSIEYPIYKTNDFYTFNKTGYATIDREGAVLGDAKHGQAKTANWDISKEEQGIVQSSTGTDYHKIFFTEEYGENFIVETTIVPVGPLGTEKYPKAGIYFHNTEGTYHTVWLDMSEANLTKGKANTKNFSNFRLVTLDNENGSWNQTNLNDFDKVNTNASNREGTKLTVIKYGSTFWYFVDGVFMTSEEKSFMDTDVLPGFYSLGGNAIYKDYSCKEINKEELTTYLNNKNLYVINAKVAGSGGSVESSTPSVKSSGSYDLIITSKSGYEVSSVIINDVEKIKDVKARANGGVYTVTGAKGNQEVKVSFTKIDGSKFTGTVKCGEDAVASEVILTGITNKALRYEVKATGAKGFNVEVPAGTYNIHIEAEGYKSYDDTVKVSGDTTKAYTLTKTTFPATIEVNGKERISSLSKWDITNEHKGYVSGSYKLGTKISPLYFAQTAKDFVLEAKIDYTTIFQSGVSYQPDLMGGFMFDDGVNTGFIMARGTGIVTTGWKFENGLLDYDMLTYPSKQTVTFTIAKSGNNAYIYFNGIFAKQMAWSEVAPDIDAKSEMALALYMVADKEADIRFSNYKVQAGTSAANSYISKHALKDTTVSQNPFYSQILTVNGTKVKSALRRWDLSEIANGTLKGSYALGSKLQPVYFTTHGNTALLETTIEYPTVFQDGVEYQPDLMGGFAFSDGTNYGWILVDNTGIAYTGWKFEQGLVKNKLLAYPDKRSVKLTVAVRNDYFFVYFDDVFVAKKRLDKIVPNAANGADLAFGLTMVADKTADIKFSNTSISIDPNVVNNYIQTHKDMN